MLKKLIIFLFIVLPVAIQAQFANVEQCADFPVASKGWLKLLQLKKWKYDAFGYTL